MTKETPSAEDGIDLIQLLQNLLHHWHWLLLSLLLAWAVAYAHLRMVQPVYVTDGVIQVDTGKTASAAVVGGGNLADALDAASPVETEIQLIKSRLVLGQVVNNLRLDLAIGQPALKWYAPLKERVSKTVFYSPASVFYRRNESYLTLASLVVPERLLDQPLRVQTQDRDYRLYRGEELLLTARFDDLVRKITPYGVLQIRIPAASPNQQFTVVQKSPRMAIQQLLGALSVDEKAQRSAIIGLTYKGQDPLLATTTLNEIMQVYVAQNFEQRSADTKRSLMLLEQQLPLLKQQLEQSEQRYNIFRRANNTVDVTKEAELLLGQTVELRSKRLELEQKLAELQVRYTDEYPLVDEVKKQLATLAVENQKIDQRLNQLPEIQRQYLQLYRDVEVNTELYTKLLNNYEQLRLIKASQSGSVRIVDRAMKPLFPISPVPSVVYLLASLIGLTLGAGLVLLKGLLRRGIKDSRSIEEQLDVPVLATIPRSPRQQRQQARLGRKKALSLLALVDGEDMSVEALRSLRTLVHLSSPENRVLLVTGPAPGIGKSFVTANFAGVLAQTGKKVILVDADMRRGHLHDYFGGGRELGLSEYLSGAATLDAVCRPTKLDALDFMSTGAIPGNPSELLMRESLGVLLDQLRQRYDHVLIDSPPVLAAADSLVIGRHAGTVLMLARFGVTALKELDLAISRMQQAGIKVDGVVLNDVLKEAGDAYNYQYGYQYRATE